MDKKELRKAISAQKRAMTAAEIEAKSAFLAEKLFAHPLYREAPSLYAYLSYNQEVRTDPILRRCLADGKRVAVPKVLDNGTRMEFIWLDDLTAVAEGYCKIPEAIAEGPVADDPRALILMPGLAFDRRGGRMGYGGGFYGRYLSEHPGHPTLALCYGFQLLDHVEMAPHDVPVDAVLWSN